MLITSAECFEIISYSYISITNLQTGIANVFGNRNTTETTPAETVTAVIIDKKNNVFLRNWSCLGAIVFSILHDRVTVLFEKYTFSQVKNVL